MSRRVLSSRAISAIALLCMVLMLTSPTMAAIVPGLGHEGRETSKAQETLNAPGPSSSASRAPAGNERYLILTSVDETDPYYDAVEALKAHRGGQVIKFDPTDVNAVLPTLKELQPRYVVVVVKPLEMYYNFVRNFLMMSTNLDEDPFSDFSYGFITGATAQDALNFVNSIVKAENEGIQDYPLNISGWIASNVNVKYTNVKTGSDWGFEDKLNPNRYSSLRMAENDSGTGVDFFHANKEIFSDNKVLDIGHNGDAHMLWLFEGQNFNPNPPVWDYDPAKIEDPAYARKGLTSHNVSTLDLYPAVVLNGACHSGEVKTVLVESDIKAAWGDTGAFARFYTMSDEFSFALSLLKTNLTGYFAPVGANNANDDGEDFFNTFLYNEPLGDIHKRSVDGVVMGFMGNRPNLKLYQDGDSAYGSDILKSGDFDPETYSGAKYMLGGKANRVYYGDPMFDPFKKNHPSDLNPTTWTLNAINETIMNIDLDFTKDYGFIPGIWDKFHESGTRIYAAIELPPDYVNVTSFSVKSSSGPYDRVIHVLEHFDGKTILHVEVDIQDTMYNPIDYNIVFQISVPPPPSHGVDILDKDLTGTVLPGGSTSYDVQVKNSGELVDDIELSNSLAPFGWGFEVDFDGVGMAPGETRSAKVQVKSDAGGLAGEQSVLLLTATIKGFPQSSDGLKVTTTIKAVYGVDISGDDLIGRARPGDTSVQTVEIKNTGNSVDAIGLSISDLSAGWPTRVDFDGKTIAAGTARNATVTVQVPIDALADTNHKFHLTAISKGDASKSDTILIETRVDPIFAVDILGVDRTCSTRPGEAIEVPITVQNLGNSVDDLLLLSTAPPTNWTVELTFNGAKVEPGQTRDGAVKIVPPKNALAGETAGIIIKAMAAGDLSMADEMRIGITVLERAGVAVANPADLSAAPGSMVRYTFEVTNSGNCDDSYLVSATSYKGWPVRVVGGPKTGNIGPGDVTKVTVETTIPKYVQGGIMDTLTLEVSSTLDPSVKSEAKVWTTSLVVNSMTLRTDSDWTSLRSGEKAFFNLTLTNTGNTDAPITIEVQTTQGSAGWTSVSMSKVDLKAGASSVVVLTVSPTKDAKPGPYVFQVKGWSGTTTASVNITVEVLENAPIKPHTNVGPAYWLIIVLVVIIVSIAIMLAYIFNKKRKGRTPHVEQGPQVTPDVEHEYNTDLTRGSFEEVREPVDYRQDEAMELYQEPVSDTYEEYPEVYRHGSVRAVEWR